MKIVQKGNQHTNSSSRDGHIPYVIVNHISAGTMSSMDSWFRSSGNKISSAHFGVSKKGEIHQYVSIDRMAWANGLKQWQQREALAEVIRNNPTINPNKYTVSIEHEGTDGQLTEAQFAASVWLHKYIKNEIKRLYGRDMVLDEYHVIGHFQVDPKRKPNCPGPKFPWDRLYKELKEEGVAVETKVKVMVNGKKVADGYLNNGTTLTPSRAVAEALGASVRWDKENLTVHITKEDK